jgi:SAM-dependent methyltransferase
METVGCLFGHEGAPELAFEGSDRLGQSRETFQIVRCSTCGLLFISPRPTLTEIMQYYPHEKYQAYGVAIADRPWRERWYLSYTQNKRCHFIETAKTRGRLLDVGCATGNFLAQIRERGNWEVYGVEINREAVEYAQQRFRLNVFHGVLEEAHYPADFFDVVTLWSVLEHLHNPLETLGEVRRILRPDGILGFTIPFGDSLDARLFGPHWGPLDPPRHLYTFTRTTLEQLLTRAGFEIVRMRSFTAGYLSLWRSIRLCVQNSEFISDTAIQRILFRLIPSPLFRVLSFPYVWVTERIGRGATISVLAKPV